MVLLVYHSLHKIPRCSQLLILNQTRWQINRTTQKLNDWNTNKTLQFTPPATPTFTPLPPTETPLPTNTPSPTLSPTGTIQPTSTSVVVTLADTESNDGNSAWLLLLAVGAVGVAIFLLVKSIKARNI